MMRTRGQIHGVNPDPHMRDEQSLRGMVAVIPALNRLAQAHEKYQAWLDDQYDGFDLRSGLSLASFDEARTDQWEDLVSLAADVVEVWVEARDRQPGKGQ